MTGKYGTNNINKKYKVKSQMLRSCELKFNFLTDAGILNYLNEMTFNTDYVDFEKIINM